MGLAPFVPQYIAATELTQYGLPTAADQPDILNLVQMASAILDEECGRIDGDGSGSLVYSTYVQRVLLQTRNRNLIYLSMRPIVAVPSGTVTALQAAATGQFNTTYTGVQPNTVTSGFSGQLSGLIAASGRYGYVRQDRSIGYPDLWCQISPLSLVTMFGGPAPFITMDVTQADYDNKTGELWLPAGLQLQQYSEIIIIYNSGYNPLAMPPQLKFACASIVKNAMAKGDATTGLISLNLGKSGANIGMQKDLIDPVLDRLLQPFRTVRAY